METCFRVSDPIGRLESFGLPRYIAKSFWEEVVKWETNSGPAWTVQRLKDLKLDLIRVKAGLPVLTWIRRNRSGGLYGAVGALFRYAAKSEKCWRAALNALMVYSGFIPSKPTKQHLEKFQKSVTAPPCYIPKDVHETLRAEARKWFEQPRLSSPVRLIDFVGSPSVKSPVFGGSSVPQNEGLDLEILWITEGHGYAHVGRPHSRFINQYYNCYGPVLDGLDRWAAQNHRGVPGTSRGLFDSRMRPFQTVYAGYDTSIDLSQVIGGKIVPLTKDGGWKVRWIASPYRLHQLALKPLGRSLLDLLKQLPWDCTHDQTKAFPFIQQHLRDGKTAFAVDLSSATDYFPLELQLQVLDELFPDCDYVSLFGALSRTAWDSPYGRFQWTKGQPMGLYPSFASFGLTHGLLLAALCGVYRRQFFVLGDDVVILDAGLYDRYIQALDMLECPHDAHKSLVSSKLTEFAGRVISERGVVPTYKWRPISDDSFLDFMRMYGQRFERNLTRAQRQVYRKVGELLEPWGCSHSLGPSRPLEELIEMTEEFSSCVKTESGGGKFYTSFLKKLIQLLQPDRSSSLYRRLDFWRMQELASTFELDVDTAFRRLPQWVNPISEDLTDLFELTGVNPGLTAVRSESFADRKTTLEQYQGWIRTTDKTK